LKFPLVISIQELTNHERIPTVTKCAIEWLLTCKRWNKLKRENTSKIYVSWDIPEKVLTVYNFFHILCISLIWLLISIEIRVLKSSCCHQILGSPQSISSSQENKIDWLIDWLYWHSPKGAFQWQKYILIYISINYYNYTSDPKFI
jgi:hypothetical protein